MRTELAVALVAGLFGLIPLMVQIVSTRAQRRDRSYRLNQLQAELELLERLHALQGKVGAPGEAANPQTNLVISDSLRKVLDQYNKLSEIAPSAVGGRKQPSARQLSFLRRAFLLYSPQTTSGWVLHTLFYSFALVYVSAAMISASAALQYHEFAMFGGWVIIAIPLAIPLLIIQRLARRNAVRKVAQSEEPNA
jgi:hypothetical protein